MQASSRPQARPGATRHRSLAAISLAAICAATLPACTGIQDARTDALENRQNRMNSRAEARAERRQIRSDNMDARTDLIFN